MTTQTDDIRLLVKASYTVAEQNITYPPTVEPIVDKKQDENIKALLDDVRKFLIDKQEKQQAHVETTN